MRWIWLKLGSYDRYLFIKERGNEIFLENQPIPHPWGGGGGVRTESKCRVLFLTMVKKKKPCRQKLNMLFTSLSERTAQNARSFKLSDRFERCANSFFGQFAHRSTLIFFHSENQRSLIAFERSLNL